MAKTTATYWNALAPENHDKWNWSPVQGLEDMANEITLSIDDSPGEYTRLTWFLPGADTTAFGAMTHAYLEEVFIVSGRLYDTVFGRWLVAGDLRQQAARRIARPAQDQRGLHCLGSFVSEPNSAPRMWRIAPSSWTRVTQPQRMTLTSLERVMYFSD